MTAGMRGRPVQPCICAHPKSHHNYQGANLVGKCKETGCGCGKYIRLENTAARAPAPCAGAVDLAGLRQSGGNAAVITELDAGG